LGFVFFATLGFLLSATVVRGDLPDGTIVQIWNCTFGSPLQKWSIANDGTWNFRLQFNQKCLDIANWATENGAVVHLWTCHPNDKPENQQWNLDSNGHIVSKLNGKCLEVKGNIQEGSTTQMWDCADQANQKWFYNNSDGTFRSSQAPNLCLDVGSTLSCGDYPLNTYRYCNWTLPIEERLRDLLSRMTLEEKMPQMLSGAPAIPRLGIPAYGWWTECLHGVLSPCGHNCPTSFPAPSALGATFNMTLIHKMATAISTEARALNNEKITGLDYWAPNININRDPRWGRNQEVPGEDPYLTSQYVTSFIRGLQEGFDPRYTKVVGTCKHYAAYSLENWNGTDRFHFNAVVTDRDLVDTYLPAWKACVSDARARSVMCSYNSVNGIPACASDFLLQDILRDEFGFDGYVVSDCDAVDCIMSTHHYTDNPGDTCRVAVTAGTDLDCGNFYEHLPEAISQGKLKEEDITLAVSRLYRQRFELGMFDPVEIQPYTRIAPSVVDSVEHRQLALEAARQSMVLLQNHGGLLPLSKKYRIAVIGPNANVTETLLSNYHGSRCHDGTYNCVETPLNAIRAKVPQVIYAKGCSISGTDKSDFPEAVKIAQGANVAVLFVGIDNTIESEGLDRTNISLPGVQEDLVREVVATGTPTVVVLINGGSLAIEWIKDHVPAILEAWYAGEMASYAIADVLFGDYNPGGKLPNTIFEADYVNQISLFNMNMADSPGRTYRYYTGKPLWPFGFGLSYTTFNITWESPLVQTVNTLDNVFDVSFRATVRNTGHIAGDEVVMAFVINSAPHPLKQLFGFQRVTLAPGQQKEVFFAGGAESFSFVDPQGQRVVIPGTYTVVLSNGLQEVSGQVNLLGNALKLFSLRK